MYVEAVAITPGGEGHYLVEGSGNSHNLVVLNAGQEDAGQYTCDCRFVSSSALAEIILLGN